jgi:hypothetical protein
MATIRVSSENEFTKALLTANGGDTILLKSGTYSDLDIKDNRQNALDFSSTVTIRSEDPNNRAVINELLVQGASNIKISDVVLDYTGRQAADSESWVRGSPFFFKGTTDITLSDVEVKGNLVNGFGEKTGIYVNTSKGFTLENSKITDFNLALNAWGSEDVTIKGNSFRGMNHDGLFFGEIDGIRIEDNFIGDYHSDAPAALHKDNIQFYTGKDFGPSNDIVIRGNTLDSSDHRHGVFIFNELYRDGNTSDSIRHRNILIEDNYIHTTNTHGITVTHADGVTVRNNTVILNDEGGFDQVPLINVSLTSKNVDIVGNTVASVQGEEDGTWNVSGNIVEGFSRFHWSGVFQNGQLVKGIIPAPDKQFPSSGGDQDVFKFVGGHIDPDHPVTITGLDLDQGDELALSGFDRGTFTGSAATDGGSGFNLDSVKELKEIVYWSEDVVGRASHENNDLFLYIDQGQEGVATFILADYF